MGNSSSNTQSTLGSLLSIVMMKLLMILLTLGSFHNNIVLSDDDTTTAKVSLHPMSDRVDFQPLWDDVVSNTTSCILEEQTTRSEDGSQGGSFFFLRGSEHLTCSVRVTSSSPLLQTLIEIPTRSTTDTDTPFFLYIEREGNSTTCSNKYVMLEGQSEICTSTFVTDRLVLHLQGNVSVSVTRVSGEASHVDGCPEDDSMTSSPSYCNEVKGFNNRITCDLVTEEMCRASFPSGCNVTLGYREVTLNCLTNGIFYQHESLLIYSIDISTLDMGSNDIRKLKGNSLRGFKYLSVLLLDGNILERLEVNTFQGLKNLYRLYLQENRLSMLPVGLFDGLNKLSILYLHGNKIAGLDSNVFHSLESLNILTLHGNRLTSLSRGIFSMMRNLNSLYLHKNQLEFIDNEAFQGLNKLTTLYLNENKLVLLPTDLFRGLDSLASLHLYNNHIVHLNESIFLGLSNVYYLILQGNELVTLPDGLFAGTKNLYYLFLNANNLRMVNADMFQGLNWLTYLYLDENCLQSIPLGLFTGLMNLHTLYLNGNNLTSLEAGIFDGLSRLVNLVLFSNKLDLLPVDLFSGLGYLNFLYLHDNELVTLEKGLFHELVRLSVLSLNFNKLTTIPDELFMGLVNLNRLRIDNNELSTLNEIVFQNVGRLEILGLPGNLLLILPGDIFFGLRNLIDLYLFDNQLTALHSSLFNSLSNLRVLNLHRNTLVSIPESVFNGLHNLEFLTLYSNKLVILGPNIFKGLAKLSHLLVFDNQISELYHEIFNDTVLSYLELSENRFEDCPSIKGLPHLNFLSLFDNDMSAVTPTSFSNLPNKTELLVSQHEICECYVPVGRRISCSATDERSPYLTCHRMLSDRLLVAMMWIIGVNAFGGNVFVLVWRKKNTNKYKVQDLLLSSLAMGDSLMGLYMLIIAFADIYFGDNFPMLSETWRAGITCRVAGALSITSSEASVFFVSLISIDRYISIKFPYSKNKMGRKSTIVTSTLLWIISLVLGIVPSILAGRSFKFYDNSHVCIGLPLALTKMYSNIKNTTILTPENTILSLTKHRFTTQFDGYVTGLYYSTALFLALNCLCYLIILGCYIEIIRAVITSSKQSGRTRDMTEQIRLTTKVAAIVATDFMCWFPIIILGILVQTRVVTLPPSVYAWSVTFILPFNSAINPYLYTIAEIMSNYRKKQVQKNNSSQITQTQTSKM